MKFRVRNDEKNEFEIRDVRIIEAKTKGFLAKATIIAGMAVLVLTAVYFAISRDGGELSTVVKCTISLVGVVLWHYFRKPDG